MEAHRPPPVLYHFASVEGVEGILTSKKLWASLATSLNDATEITYGIERTKRYIKKRLEQARGVSLKREAFLTYALRWLEGEGVNTDLLVNIEHFVVSFCGRVDKSGMWLHYGRSGTGYALGFDAARLARAPFDLWKVIYDPEEQDDFIHNAVSIIEEEFLDVAFEQDVDTLARAGGAASHLCATTIRAMAARLKDPAFDCEYEWRLGTMDVTGAHIEDTGIELQRGDRVSGDRTVPYMVADYGADLPLAKVIVGYSVDLDAANSTLALKFREEKIRPVPISKSEVPIR